MFGFAVSGAWRFAVCVIAFCGGLFVTDCGFGLVVGCECWGVFGVRFGFFDLVL